MILQLGSSFYGTGSFGGSTVISVQKLEEEEKLKKGTLLYLTDRNTYAIVLGQKDIFNVAAISTASWFKTDPNKLLEVNSIYVQNSATFSHLAPGESFVIIERKK